MIPAAAWYFGSIETEGAIVANLVQGATEYALFESAAGVNFDRMAAIPDFDVEGLVAFMVDAANPAEYQIRAYDDNGIMLAQSQILRLDPDLGRDKPEGFNFLNMDPNGIVYEGMLIEWTPLAGAESYLVLIEEEPSESPVALFVVGDTWFSYGAPDDFLTEYLRKPLTDGQSYGVAIIALDAQGNPIGNTGSTHISYMLVPGFE